MPDKPPAAWIRWLFVFCGFWFFIYSVWAFVETGDSKWGLLAIIAAWGLWMWGCDPLEVFKDKPPTPKG